MIVSLLCATTFAADWTFPAEVLDTDGEHRVLAVGDDAEAPAGALCASLDPCTVQVPRKASKHTNDALLGPDTTGSTWIVRTLAGAPEIAVVALHDGERWTDRFVVSPGQPPRTAHTVARIQARLVALETTVAQGGAPGQPVGRRVRRTDPVLEQAGAKLYREANDAVQKMQWAAARAALEELRTRYGETRSAQNTQGLQQILDLIGSQAPAVESDNWMQGERYVAESPATLLVFFDIQNTHSKRALSRFQDFWDAHRREGLLVVGLTLLRGSTTADTVAAGLQRLEVTFPVGQDDRDLGGHFGRTTVPVAAMVEDGTVLWVGHPARLTEDILAGWLTD